MENNWVSIGILIAVGLVGYLLGLLEAALKNSNKKAEQEEDAISASVEGDEVDVPESNWMKKVRALLVLGETTDYLESDSSVSGDHVVNMVEKFHNLAGSALVDKSGKDRIHPNHQITR